jgi:hypothetical protein
MVRRPRGSTPFSRYGPYGDEVSAVIAPMTVEEENRWLRSEELPDPALKRLMDRAATAASRGDKGVGKNDGTLPAKPD